MACDAPVPIKYNPPIFDGKGGLIYWFPADCGKCLKCLIKRKAQWSFRMCQEKRDSFSSFFITLTYSEENVPYGEDGFCGNKNDHFEFIQKLKELESTPVLNMRESISMEELVRKKAAIPENKKLKYYGVSEYGDTFSRPHWHYILFNVHDVNNVNKAWGKGITQVDECNVNTIDYVLKYMLKERSDSKKEGREIEKSFMSKGIGLSAANDEFIHHIKQDYANQVVNQRGSKIPLPRYYRKKFLTDKEREAKGRYIADELVKLEAKENLAWKNLGLDPGEVRQGAKVKRHQLLQQRKKRNHE